MSISIVAGTFVVIALDLFGIKQDFSGITLEMVLLEGMAVRVHFSVQLSAHVQKLTNSISTVSPEALLPGWNDAVLILHLVLPYTA